jgi:uncharacterized membrane protein
VTRIAWLLIGLSVVMIVLTLAQYGAFLRTLATIEDIHRGAPSSLPTTRQHLAMIAQLVVGCASLVASIGLLKRWRWARRAILAFASMGLASNVYILRPSVPILVLLDGRRCLPCRATYQKP